MAAPQRCLSQVFLHGPVHLVRGPIKELWLCADVIRCCRHRLSIAQTERIPMQQHSLMRRAGELCDPGKQHAPGGGAVPPHRALASMVQPDGSAVEKIHLRAPALRIVPFRFLGLYGDFWKPSAACHSTRG